MENENKTEAKILITSDIHFGRTGDGNFVPESERIQTFKNITALAKEHDLLFVAGDLIDSSNISIDLRNMIANEFKEVRATGTEILYTPGIGEQDKDEELHGLIYDFGVSRIFSKQKRFEPYSIEIGTEQLRIYGEPSSPDFSILNVKREDLSGFHIGLFHCETEVDKLEIPVPGYDFYVLGYGHTSRIFKSSDGVIGANSGSPVAVELKETGERYVISISISDGKIINVERIPVNSVQILNIEINCNNFSTSENLKNLLLEKASTANILHVSLSGEYDFSIKEVIENIKDQFCDIVITDNAIPSFKYYTTMYENEKSIRGEFFRILKEQLSQDNQSAPSFSQLTGIVIALLADDVNVVEEWLCDL